MRGDKSEIRKRDYTFDYRIYYRNEYFALHMVD